MGMANSQRQTFPLMPQMVMVWAEVANCRFKKERKLLPIEIEQVLGEVHFIAPTVGVMISGLLAALLLIASGFASGSEIAIFSLSPSDLDELAEEKTDRDRQIMELRKDSERTLATILITNNLVNVTIIMLCNYFFGHIIDFGTAYWLQFFCITVILTFILLLFGEILPKVYCGQNPLKFCRSVVGVLLFCRKLFFPLPLCLCVRVFWRRRSFRKKAIRLVSTTWNRRWN